jgi:hypothetical protein
MAKVTNISTGPRGAYLNGHLVMAERGQTIEADDYAPEWFKAASAASESDEPKALSKMNKAELLDTAKAEGVAVEDGATNSEIVAGIEKGRAAK